MLCETAKGEPGCYFAGQLCVAIYDGIAISYFIIWMIQFPLHWIKGKLDVPSLPITNNLHRSVTNYWSKFIDTWKHFHAFFSTNLSASVDLNRFHDASLRFNEDFNQIFYSSCGICLRRKKMQIKCKIVCLVNFCSRKMWKFWFETISYLHYDIIKNMNLLWTIQKHEHEHVAFIYINTLVLLCSSRNTRVFVSHTLNAQYTSIVLFAWSWINTRWLAMNFHCQKSMEINIHSQPLNAIPVRKHTKYTMQTQQK